MFSGYNPLIWCGCRAIRLFRVAINALNAVYMIDNIPLFSYFQGSFWYNSSSIYTYLGRYPPKVGTPYVISHWHNHTCQESWFQFPPHSSLQHRQLPFFPLGSFLFPALLLSIYLLFHTIVPMPSPLGLLLSHFHPPCLEVTQHKKY